MKDCYEMKGFLSFLVLRLIFQKEMSGEQIRCELEKRKGTKPSPGTIYPVLKGLKENGWIAEVKAEVKDGGREKKYALTSKGRKEVTAATKRFLVLFCDLREFRR